MNIEDLMDYKDVRPSWILGMADEGYTTLNASLPTRNGLRVGNAIFIEEIKDNLFLCITDAGSELKLNMAELEELFYLPIFTCDPDTHLGYQHYLSNMEPT